MLSSLSDVASGNPVVGERTAPRRPYAISDAHPRQARLPVAACLLVTALTAALAIARTATPAGSGEAVVAANAYRLGELGGAPIDASWSQEVAGWQLAAFSWLTGGSAQTLTGPSRALVGVTAVLTALAVYALARRLEIRPWSAAAAGILSAAPASLTLARIIDVSASLSVMWFLGGSAVALLPVRGGRSGQRSWWTRLTWPVRVFGVAAMTWAVIAAPVHALLPAAVAVGLALAWPLSPSWTRVERVGATAVAALLLLGLLWATVGPAGRTDYAADSAGLAPAAVVAVVVLVALAATAAILAPWARPLAFAAAPLAVVALVPSGARTPGLLLSVALLAVLGAITLDELMSRPAAVGRLRRPALVAAAAVVLVAVGLAPAAASDPVVRQDPNVIASWVEANLSPDAILIVDPVTSVDLRRVGVDPRRLRTEAPDDSTGPLGDAEPAPPLFRLDRIDTDPDLPLIAQFGSGANTLGLRQVLADPAANRVAAESDRQARIRFGSALAQNPNLNFGTTARAQLRAGEVDARLLLVLAAATMDVRMSVPEFISTSADPAGAILRRVQLADVVADDSDLSAAVAIDRLADFLGEQQPPFAPSELRADARSLSVGYLAPTPLGLLE